MLIQNVDQQMLSSLALFKGIANDHKGDIWAIVRDFIVATIKHCNLSTFDIQQLRDSMNKGFNIDIENAVLVNVLNKIEYIQSNYCHDTKNAFYSVDSKLTEIDLLAFESELTNNNKQCDQLLDDLYSFYCKENNQETIEEKVKILIQDYFFRYTIDYENIDMNNEIVVLINRFVLTLDNSRIALLSNIRQGLIMLEGLNYSKQLDHKTWKYDTTFFLDAHYLFSLYGFNSSYHKSSVCDFIELVKQINKGYNAKYPGKKRIELYYFPETKKVIDEFFRTAFRIKMGDETLKQNNEAMSKIIEQCNDSADVSALKIKFYNYLLKEGIKEFPDEIDLKENKDFLFETEDLSNLVEKEFKKENQEEVYGLFRTADYINILRKGRAVTNLESCKYIFLTDKNISLQVSKFLRRNDEQASINVFEKMDWFTQRMWFVTCQSLTFDKNLTSFDLAIKAKMVLSGICQSNVSEIYEKLKEKNYPDEEVAEIYHQIRNYNTSADIIDSTTPKEYISKFNQGALEQFHESYIRLITKANGADDAERKSHDLEQLVNSLTDKTNEQETTINELINSQSTTKKIVYVLVGIVVLLLFILIYKM